MQTMLLYYIQYYIQNTLAHTHKHTHTHIHNLQPMRMIHGKVQWHEDKNVFKNRNHATTNSNIRIFNQSKSWFIFWNR